MLPSSLSSFWRFILKSYGDTLVSTDFLRALIRCALWLLENQLPFFVLQELYHSAFGSYPDIYPPFLELTFKFFHLYNHQGKKPIGRVLNFTDLLRTFFLPPPGKSQEKKQNTTEHELELEIFSQMLHLPNATQLHAAGVMFCATKANDCLT